MSVSVYVLLPCVSACVPALCVDVCVYVDFVSSAAEKLCMQFARTPPSAANVFN